MAKPQRTYPESATKGGQEADTEAGRQALEEALGRHGEELAAAIEGTDELDDLLSTAILTIATADQEEIDRTIESLSALVQAGDGLATEETAQLASEVGENADDLAGLLDAAARLEREGNLDGAVTLAAALSSSASDEQVDRLAETIDEGGDDVVETLEMVVELQREGHLDELLATGKLLAQLDVDEDSVRGLNRLLSAVGDAERESEPAGLLGALRQLRSRDGRSGLGYLLALLRSLGRSAKGG